MVFESEANFADSHLFLVVDFNFICRFCLRSGGALTDIFNEEKDSEIANQLSSFASIDVQPNENLPTKICHRCRYMIETCHEFKELVMQSHKTLLESAESEYNDSKEKLMETDDSKMEFNEKVEDNSEMMLSKDKLFYESILIGKNSEDDINALILSNYNEEDGINKNIDEDNKMDLKKLVDSNFDLKFHKRKRKHKNDKKNGVAESNTGAQKLKDFPTLFITCKSRYCLLCLEKFDDESDLHEHIDKHVAGTNLEPYYIYKERDIPCKPCGKFFNYRYSFLIHQREHLNLKPFHCTYEGCDNAFFSKAALRQHLPTHAQRNFICSVCALGFKRKSDLRGHEIIHEDAGVQYECPICNCVCKNRLTRAAHMKKHHKQPTYKCGSCHKQYFSKSELQRHEYIHSPEKRFRCDRCPYAYYSRSALLRHEKIRHVPDESTDKNEPERKCPLCWQIHIPISPRIYMKHLEEPTAKDFPYRCNNCTNGYLEKLCLKKHADSCLSINPQITQDCTDKVISTIDNKFIFMQDS